MADYNLAVTGFDFHTCSTLITPRLEHCIELKFDQQ